MLKKLFLLILIIGFAGSVFTKDSSFSAYENRSPQTLPAFSIRSVLDGSYTKKFDTYVSDQFIFRNSWIRTKTLSDEKLLGKNCINDVYLGKDGYLISRYTEADFQPKTLEKNVKYLKEFMNSYDANVILVPTASEVLTNRLPIGASHISQKELLSEVPTSLDITSVLSKHREEPIYFRTDHHWSLLGAYYVYEQLVAEPIPYETETVSTDFYGTTYRKINIPVKPDFLEKIKSPNTFSVVYDETITSDSLYNEKALETTDKYPYYLDGNHAITQITNQTIPSDKSLLIIKDSFANIFATLICNNYKNTYMIDLRHYNGSIREYIKENQIDEVMFLYNNINFMQDKNLVKLVH